MKKLKIITICLFISLISSAGIYAQQNKDTMSLLTQNEWTVTFSIGKNDSIVSVLHFTQTEYINKSSYQQSRSEVSVKYYLSDKLETVFDHDKVGKVFDGRYIIMINKYSVISAYEIIKISESEFDFIPINPLDQQTRSSESRKTFTARVNPK